MKAVVYLLVLFCTSIAWGQSAAKDDELKNDLVRLEKQSWDAWKARDGKFYQGFLSDDHVEVGGSGVDAKPAIVAFVGSPVCVIKSYAVDQFSFTLFNNDTALLTYHAQQDGTCGGKPIPSPAWVSSLYVRRNGHWQNALYQQTPTAK